MQVGDGNLTRFWHDIWVLETPLKSRFSAVFKVVRNGNATVAEVRSVVNNVWAGI